MQVGECMNEWLVVAGMAVEYGGGRDGAVEWKCMTWHTRFP